MDTGHIPKRHLERPAPSLPPTPQPRQTIIASFLDADVEDALFRNDGVAAGFWLRA